MIYIVVKTRTKRTLQHCNATINMMELRISLHLPNKLGGPTLILLDNIGKDSLESVLSRLGAAKHREIFDLESLLLLTQDSCLLYMNLIFWPHPQETQ